MKRIGLITVTLGLFAISLYTTLTQGTLSGAQAMVDGSLRGVAASPLVYTGFQAEVAKLFATVLNSLIQLTGGSVMWGIMLLALLVELLLLYPSVRIQLKQKKIHLFHKKLVDRFNRGELTVSKTENELEKLYAVNEQIHRRGAMLVMTQIVLLFFTFWGLNLMVHVPGLITGSWSALSTSLLAGAETYAVPLMAALLYFFHAMVKIHFKDAEDYISTAQTTLAFILAIIGAVAVFAFAGIVAVALTLYFMTLVTVATVRYIIVEKNAKEWGALAQRELIQMLRDARGHRNRFEYFSRLWNHLPVVRHLNFNLLEEALSMTLGLILALTFFGAFQEDQYSFDFHTPHQFGMHQNQLNPNA